MKERKYKNSINRVRSREQVGGACYCSGLGWLSMVGIGTGRGGSFSIRARAPGEQT